MVKRRQLVVALLLSLFAGMTASVPAFSDDHSVFTIGRVSKFPELEKPRMEALAAWLADHLENGDKIKFRIKVVPGIRDMMNLLEAGEVDLVSETPWSAIHFVNTGSAEIILRERKFGVGEYHSVLMADGRTPVAKPSDLKGHIVAFEDPGSTTGFMLPLSILIDQGLKVRRVLSLDEPVGEDEVGFIFAGSIDQAADWLQKGLVCAIGMSDYDQKTSKSMPREARRYMTAIGRSEPVLRSLVLVRTGMPESRKSEIIELLTNMPHEENGWDTMIAYNRVRGFDPLDSELLQKVKNLRQTAAKVIKAIGGDPLIAELVSRP